MRVIVGKGDRRGGRRGVPTKPPAQTALVTTFLSASRPGFGVPVKVYSFWYNIRGWVALG